MTALRPYLRPGPFEAEARFFHLTATRALDRVLQWGFYVIPHYHAPYDRIAYWDMFGRPKTTPIRGNQFDAWWVDAEKQKALGLKRKAFAK